jgi:hypothetical protein
MRKKRSLIFQGFSHLTWFRENIAKDRDFIGILLYTGENVLSYGRDMYAVSVAALWE